MTKQRVAVISGTRGMLSPLARGRHDIELYKQTYSNATNWLVLREGSMRRRSGTRYIGAAKAGNTTIRLIPFEYSQADSMTLEFGPLYVRFWTENGQLQSGGSPYEIVSPFTPDHIPGRLQYQQSGNVLYMTTPGTSIKPQTLRRNNTTDWTFSDTTFVDGPYYPINDQYNKVVTDVTIEAGVTVECTFENTLGVNGGAGFVSTDVGRHFRLQMDGKWAWGTISAVTSTTVIEVDFVTGNGAGGSATNNNLSLGGAFGGGFAVDWTGATVGSNALNNVESYSWRLGAFSETTGYPRCVREWDGRLFYAATTENPRFVAYSFSGLPGVFSPSNPDGTVTDAHGGALTLTNADRILWLADGSHLIIGTPSGIHSLGPSSNDVVFGPRSFKHSRVIPETVGQTLPVAVANSTLHTTRFGRAIHDLYYDFQANSLVRPELSTSAEHLFDAAVKELHFAEDPYKRLFALLEDGDIAVSVLDRFEKVNGFTSMKFSRGDVMSMCVTPGSDRQVVFFLTRRTINGTQVQYIETLADDFVRTARTDVEDAFFVDCGGTYDGAVTGTISGATWLAGETVDLLIDGYPAAQTTVSASGVITLPSGRTGSKIQFGIPIATALRPHRPPISVQEGDALGVRMRVVGVDVDVLETGEMSVTSNMGQTDRLFEQPATNSGNTHGLYSGEMRTIIDGSWTSSGVFTISTPYPLPATIRALIVTLNAES